MGWQSEKKIDCVCGVHGVISCFVSCEFVFVQSMLRVCVCVNEPFSGLVSGGAWVSGWAWGVGCLGVRVVPALQSAGLGW